MGAQELFHGGDGIIDGAAAAAGERVGFEARDAGAFEPGAEGVAGGRRAQKGRDGGLEEHVEGCESDVKRRLHGSSVSRRQGGGSLKGSEASGRAARAKG